LKCLLHYIPGYLCIFFLFPLCILHPTSVASPFLSDFIFRIILDSFNVSLLNLYFSMYFLQIVFIVNNQLMWSWASTTYLSPLLCFQIFSRHSVPRLW
jgi:hypothetical protein